MGTLSGAAAAPSFYDAPGRPALLEKILTEIDGLEIDQRTSRSVATNGKPQTGLDPRGHVRVAVVKTQRVCEKSGQHRTPWKPIGHPKVVDDHAAKAHQWRIEAQHERV